MKFEKKMKVEVDEGKKIALNRNSGVLLLFVIPLHFCVDCYTYYSVVVIANDLLNQLPQLCDLLPYARVSSKIVHASHQRQRLYWT